MMSCVRVNFDVESVKQGGLIIAIGKDGAGLSMNVGQPCRLLRSEKRR